MTIIEQFSRPVNRTSYHATIKNMSRDSFTEGISRRIASNHRQFKLIPFVPSKVILINEILNFQY